MRRIAKTERKTAPTPERKAPRAAKSIGGTRSRVELVACRRDVFRRLSELLAHLFAHRLIVRLVVALEHLGGLVVFHAITLPGSGRGRSRTPPTASAFARRQIGRASCREGVSSGGG